MGVTGLGDDGFPITGGDKVEKGPDHARVMDDFRAGIFRQEGGGQQPHHILAVHKRACFVKEETAVEIAVPSHAHRGPFRDHAVSGLRAVFRQQRVRDTVRKAAIGVVVVADELERGARLGQLVSDHVKRRPGHAVACVHHDLHRLQRGKINEGGHQLRIGVAWVLFGVAALLFDVAERVMLAQDNPSAAEIGREPSRTILMPL